MTAPDYRKRKVYAKSHVGSVELIAAIYPDDGIKRVQAMSR